MQGKNLFKGVVHNVSTVKISLFSSHSVKYNFNSFVSTQCQLILGMIFAIKTHLSVNIKERKQSHRHIYVITERTSLKKNSALLLWFFLFFFFFFFFLRRLNLAGGYMFTLVP
jgi:uncharacterized membrane protein